MGEVRKWTDVPLQRLDHPLELTWSRSYGRLVVTTTGFSRKMAWPNLVRICA
jgi:hypothetical protein